MGTENYFIPHRLIYNLYREIIFICKVLLRKDDNNCLFLHKILNSNLIIINNHCNINLGKTKKIPIAK